MKTRITQHHLVPKSKNWTNNKVNLLPLRSDIHSAFHMIFKDDTPQEQIQTLLNINTTVLTEEVKSDIIHILDNKELDYWYKRKAFKK